MFMFGLSILPAQDSNFAIAIGNSGFVSLSLGIFLISFGALYIP